MKHTINSKFRIANKKISFTVLVILIISLVLFSGCTQAGYSSRNYRTGTQGVMIEFSKNLKSVVYEREEFGNIIFIKNKGATNIMPENPAVLRIAYDDYRLNVVSGSPTEITISGLEGKNQYNPVGSEDPIETYFVTNLLTSLRETSDTKITYNLCYPYVTELTTMTCIDTKTATRSDESAACKSETYNGAAGQGAPIVISKIVPEIQLQSNYVRPQFNIYIENRGDGYVTKANSCSGADITNGDIVGIVNVQAEISGVPLKCGSTNEPGNSGTVKLTSSESFIKCYMPIGANGYSRDQKNYLTPLTVRVTYTYISIAELDVEIKRDTTINNRPEETYDNYDTILQGRCNSYQVEYNGVCISKCEYCASNPTDGNICGNNKPFDTFTFKNNFDCNCDLALCTQKTPNGECIKGYCPGSVYCCANSPCAKWQVWDAGTDSCIDKCQYCALNPTDTSKCSQNSQGYSCNQMTTTQLKAYKSSGVNSKIINGYCDDVGGRYCINNPAALGITGYATATVIDSSTSTDLCSFCAGNGGCTFTTNGVTANIDSEFRCDCNIEDSQYIESYNFVSEANYCTNGAYCCKKPG